MSEDLETKYKTYECSFCDDEPCILRVSSKAIEPHGCPLAETEEQFEWAEWQPQENK